MVLVITWGFISILKTLFPMNRHILIVIPSSLLVVYRAGKPKWWIPGNLDNDVPIWKASWQVVATIFCIWNCGIRKSLYILIGSAVFFHWSTNSFTVFETVGSENITSTYVLKNDHSSTWRKIEFSGYHWANYVFMVQENTHLSFQRCFH